MISRAAFSLIIKFTDSYVQFEALKNKIDDIS